MNHLILKTINNVNTARVATFNKTYKMDKRNDKFIIIKNIDGTIFPPCQSELIQYLLCTSYIAHLGSHAHQSIPSELSPINYGWRKENDKYTFKWFDGDQVPPTITSVIFIDDNPAENIESGETEPSDNTKENNAEEAEIEQNITIASSDDSDEESDYETDTLEELNEEMDF